MTEATVPVDILCPGCHFQCKLVKYQCGRGKEFYDLAAAGGEVPERRGPMMTPSERTSRPDGLPPLNDRVMHGLNITAHRLRSSHTETAVQKVVMGLARGGSFMAQGILAKRSMLSREELDEVLEASQDAGFVVMEDEPHAGRIARLTDTGAEQAATWKAERDEHTAELLSTLSDEEKETLDKLLRKMNRMG